jgi:hypothetical protein
MVKVIALIAAVASAIAYYVYQTNYAATGLWLDWNPDYGVAVNFVVNMMLVGGCVTLGTTAVAAVDKIIEKFAPENVAIMWRRIIA